VSYRELAATARALGYRRQISLWNGGRSASAGRSALRWRRALVRRLPRRIRWRLGHRIIPG